MNDNFKLNLILLLLVAILVVMIIMFIKSSSLVDRADLQLTRAEYLAKMLLRGCNGTEI